MTIKAKKSWFLVLVLSVVICLALILTSDKQFNNYPIKFSEAEVQQKINEKLPVGMKKFFLNINVLEADVKFRNQKAIVSYHTKIGRKKEIVDITAMTSGEIFYDKRRDAFYLHQSEFVIQNLDIKRKEFLEKLSSSINGLIPESIKDNYSIDTKVIEKQIIGLLEAVAKTSLDHFPIYRLKDNFSGWMMGVSLKSVEIQDGYLIAYVSFWNLTMTLLLYAFIFVVALIIAIVVAVRCPEVLFLFA